MVEETTPGETEERQERSDVGLIEKAFLMGLGAAVLTRDKVNELADELVQRGQVSKTDASKFTSDLIGKADKTMSQAGETIAEETGKVVARMGLATKSDIERLESELTELKAMIAALRPPGTGTE